MNYFRSTCSKQSQCLTLSISFCIKANWQTETLPGMQLQQEQHFVHVFSCLHSLAWRRRPSQNGTCSTRADICLCLCMCTQTQRL